MTRLRALFLFALIVLLWAAVLVLLQQHTVRQLVRRHLLSGP